MNTLNGVQSVINNVNSVSLCNGGPSCSSFKYISRQCAYKDSFCGQWSIIYVLHGRIHRSGNFRWRGKIDLVLLLKIDVSHFGTCGAIIFLCYYIAVTIRIIKFASLRLWEHQNGVIRKKCFSLNETLSRHSLRQVMKKECSKVYIGNIIPSKNEKIEVIRE